MEFFEVTSLDGEIAFLPTNLTSVTFEGDKVFVSCNGHPSAQAKSIRLKRSGDIVAKASMILGRIK